MDTIEGVATMRCVACPFEGFGVCDVSDDGKQSGLRYKRVTFPPRHILQKEGETPRQVYLLNSGWALQFKLLSDGRRQILSYFLPGDLVSLQALLTEKSTFSVQSLTEVSLCAFDAGSLARWIHGNGVLWERLEASLYVESDKLVSRITDLGRRTALERIARFIIEFDNRVRPKNGEAMSFPLRQHHIADTLGLTPVHVSRTIKELRQKNIVEIGQCNLRILDRQALGEAAGAGDGDLSVIHGSFF